MKCKDCVYDKMCYLTHTSDCKACIEAKPIIDEEVKALAGLIENRINAACADLRENKIIDVYEKLNAIHKAFSTLQNKLEGENK